VIASVILEWPAFIYIRIYIVRYYWNFTLLLELGPARRPLIWWTVTTSNIDLLVPIPCIEYLHIVCILYYPGLMRPTRTVLCTQHFLCSFFLDSIRILVSLTYVTRSFILFLLIVRRIHNHHLLIHWLVRTTSSMLLASSIYACTWILSSITLGWIGRFRDDVLKFCPFCTLFSIIV
jgi:hypothetical protein